MQGFMVIWSNGKARKLLLSIFLGSLFSILNRNSCCVVESYFHFQAETWVRIPYPMPM